MTHTTAAVLRELGRATTIEELEVAEPRAGEVRVRVLASGVCHSDLHVRDGAWPRPTPIVLGHEGAGVIETIGPGVTDLEIGQPVALSWLVPCAQCRSCQADRPWACLASPSFRHAMGDGATVYRTGAGESILSYCGIATMAGLTVVPASAAIVMPEGLDPAVAALIGCCVSTGVGAVLKTADVPRGASVAIVGLGGVGLSVVMGAVLAGASRIIAIDRVAAKLDLARAIGATDGLLAGSDRGATIEGLRDLTDGGPDFVFEAIGRIDTVELAIEASPLGGTVVLVGLTRPRSGRRSPCIRSSMGVAGSSARTTDSPTPRSTFLDTPTCTSPVACRSSA